MLLLSIRSKISHEIRTPLTSLIGTAKLLRETYLDPQQQALLTDILASAQQLFIAEQNIHALVCHSIHGE